MVQRGVLRAPFSVKLEIIMEDIIFGRGPVLEALKNSHPIDKIIIKSGP